MANQEEFENLTLDEGEAEELIANIPVEEEKLEEIMQDNEENKEEEGALYDKSLFAAEDGAGEEEVDFD